MVGMLGQKLIFAIIYYAKVFIKKLIAELTFTPTIPTTKLLKIKKYNQKDFFRHYVYT